MRIWTFDTTDQAVFSLCLQNGFGTRPPNDSCESAILLPVGSGPCTNGIIGNLFNADVTAALTGNPDCTVNTTLKNDVWYKAIVPASGNLIVQTSATNSEVNDLVMIAYLASCDVFTEIACDEDGNPAPFPSANHPRISLSGRTPGETILYRVLPRNGNDLGEFSICAFDSVVTAIPFVGAAQFKIYPNPVTEKINIDLPASNTVYTIYITSIEGKTIRQLRIIPDEKTASVDATDLAEGVYIIKVQSGTQNASVKFIKD